MGPPGGDVRILASDPSNPSQLYLGTSDGHVFGSRDSGQHWELLGRAGSRTDSVITAMLVDPGDSRRLFAAAWTLEPQAGGGVFRSDDGGHTWRPAGLAGKAVRALALAPSQPGLLVAGALDGVFLSRDAGATWGRISPEEDEELHNIDSVAIDPRNPEVIYAGTYHLPWKTSDGGKHWLSIHEGMIDDSDVMSIVVDRANPRRIYASACSGIYRSENNGALWKKIQGIPYAARRTHVIRQDAARPGVVYAATTEGLWRTSDAGASWQRLTPPSWVITALALDAGKPGRVVIGVERVGVLASDVGGKNFRPANEGFAHRQIISLALDPQRPSRVLAVLAGAPEPLLATDDGGQVWNPLGPGLKTEGLKRVYASPGGWWASLERGGLMRYDAGKGAWLRAGNYIGEEMETPDRHGKKRAKPVPPGPRPLQQVVNDMAFSREAWFAATEQTLLVSRDQGETWEPLPLGPVSLPTRSVRVSADGRNLWVVSLRGMVFSHDAGKTWAWRDLPYDAGGALRLDIAEEDTFLATAAKALYISRDAGRNWQKAGRGLPEARLQDLAIIGKIFLASMESGGLFLSRDRGATWERIEGTLAEGFFPVITTTAAADIVYAASSTDGLYAVELRTQKGASGAPLQTAPPVGLVSLHW